jgi:hypothetical protein
VVRHVRRRGRAASLVRDCAVAGSAVALGLRSAMASAALRRVGKVLGYALLSVMGAKQRREFQGALLEADSFEDLPGKWQAAILMAEQNRPKLRVVTGD